MTDKLGEGVQIFKVFGPVESNDYIKHIQESETLYKSPEEEDEAQIKVRSVKLYPKGKKDDNEAIVYIKLSGGYKPDIYYKNIGITDLNLVMQQIQEKGAPEKDGKPFEVVSGEELEKVKTYFKPKEKDSNKPKSKSDDFKTPKAYFYTTKVKNKENENTPSIIQSITILSDPNNNLNKGQNIEKLFMDNINKDMKPNYYFTPYNPNSDESLQMQQIDEKEKVNEIKLRNDGDGLQLIKTFGKVSANDMGQHLREAQKIAKQPKEEGKMPTTFYYKTKVLGSEITKEGNLEGEKIGKVDSVTIKKDPDNSMHKGKDIETVFKEGEDEEEDKGKDLGEPIYYFTKIKGGEMFKPGNVQLYSAYGTTKIDDLYNEIQKLGPLEKNDGIQLFKVSGEVDNNNLISHVKEAQELYNNPEEDKKSDEPTTSYYTTEVLGDSSKKPENENLISSVTIKRDPNNELNKNKNIEQVFKSE